MNYFSNASFYLHFGYAYDVCTSNCVNVSGDMFMLKQTMSVKLIIAVRISERNMVTYVFDVSH